MIIVETSAQHMYRTILFGSLYEIGLCDPAEGFRNMGRREPYDPDVSLDETGDDG